MVDWILEGARTLVIGTIATPVYIVYCLGGFESAVLFGLILATALPALAELER